MLFLERKDTTNQLDFTGLPSRLDPTILCRQHSIARLDLNPPNFDFIYTDYNRRISRNTDWSAQKHKVLEASELPTPGTVVAIDAEFVALQQVSDRSW